MPSDLYSRDNQIPLVIPPPKSHRDATHIHKNTLVHTHVNAYTCITHPHILHTHMQTHMCTHMHTYIYTRCCFPLLMVPLHSPDTCILCAHLRVANFHSSFNTCLEVISLKNIFLYIPIEYSINTSILTMVIWFKMVCLLTYLLQ